MGESKPELLIIGLRSEPQILSVLQTLHIYVFVRDVNLSTMGGLPKETSLQQGIRASFELEMKGLSEVNRNPNSSHNVQEQKMQATKSFLVFFQ